MHKQAIKHKQAIIGGGYLFTENACSSCRVHLMIQTKKSYHYSTIKTENTLFVLFRDQQCCKKLIDLSFCPKVLIIMFIDCCVLEHICLTVQFMPQRT